MCPVQSNFKAEGRRQGCKGKTLKQNGFGKLVGIKPWETLPIFATSCPLTDKA
jgi:hypothetical protein